MNPVGRLVAALAMLAISIVPSSSVAAHSGLAAASPAPGAVVGGEVDEVQLWYGGAITDISASVTAPDGTELAGTLRQASDLRMVFELDEPLSEPGEYIVSHGTTGVEDGDRIDAKYLFSYDPAAPPPVLDLVPEDDGGLAIWVWIVLAAGLVVIGVLTWRLLSSIKRARAQAT